jgi:uncharacterized protein YdeI (YjbR/CyaY-like superfamily)
VKLAFFEEAAAFRAWMEEFHQEARELWVGFHRKDSGRASITWRESVDVALCYGWIDGVRKRVDETSYSIRFTPRRADSNWSLVNVKRAQELTRMGMMRAAGTKAFEGRDRKKEGVYLYEQRKTAQLGKAEERRFRANRKAWKFFAAQPPGYRRLATWWVISAKKAETRSRRIEALIKDSEQGRRIGLLKLPAKTAAAKG